MFKLLRQLPICAIFRMTTCQFNKARHDDQPDDDPSESMGCLLFDILVDDFELYRFIYILVYQIDQ